MKISNEILNVIDTATLNGREMKLSGQVDRKLYVAVAKVIEAAGGKWNRKAGAHLFDGDAADALDQLMATGAVNTRQELQQFFTPPGLADRLVEMAQIAHGHTIYEPSAGKGALIAACDRVTRQAHIWANEPDDKLQRHLVTEFFHHFGAGGCARKDFLSVFPMPAFDRVVMNPPFARQADILHVSHAMRFLKPGGRLVAIMSAGTIFRENRLAQEFRDEITRRGGTLADLPAGSFRESGTMVSTCVLTVDG